LVWASATVVNPQIPEKISAFVNDSS